MLEHWLEVLMNLVNTQKVVFLHFINFVTSQLKVLTWLFEIIILLKFLRIKIGVEFDEPVKISQKTYFIRLFKLVFNNSYEFWNKWFLETYQKFFYSVEVSLNVHLFSVKLLPFILMKFINIPDVLFLQKRQINIRHISNDVRNVILLWSKCLKHWVYSFKYLLRVRVLQFVIEKMVENPFRFFL